MPKNRCGVVSLALGFVPSLAQALPRDTDELRIGMVTALSGSSQDLGQAMKSGVEAAFELINNSGGIHGRKLSLVAEDDGYEPARTAPAMRRMAADSGVFTFLGNVGTPTATVAVPIANELRIPMFGAFTGSGILRKSPPDRYVFNFRASYAQETGQMVRGLVNELGVRPERIAFFTQNDAYGDSGFQGGLKALQDLGFKDTSGLVHVRYPRNTDDVESAVAGVLDPVVKIDAVIMVGVYKPCAKFIKLSRKHGLKAIFANVSFVGSESLARELGAEGEGVVVTQVVPHFDSALPAAVAYRKALPAEKRNFVSFEGFIAARAFAEGLHAAGKNPTPERFVDALESGVSLDLGLGVPAALSKSRHQLSDNVWPTVIRAGRFVPFTSWKQLGKEPS